MSELDTETISINQIALHCLNKGDKQYSLPKILHDAINTVFIKRWIDDTESKPFRTAVIVKTKNNSNGKYNVIRGRSAAIYNMLCLYSFMETAAIKKLFQHYEKTRQRYHSRQFDMLYEYKKPWHFAYFGFSIENIKIQKIEQQLLDPSFDLYSKRFEPPFDGIANLCDDISPLFYINDNNIDWHTLKQQYENAERAFNDKNYNSVHNLLLELSSSCPIRLPIVESLLQKNIDIQQENEDAWSYVQKILN